MCSERVRRTFCVLYFRGWLREKMNVKFICQPEASADFPREIQKSIGNTLGESFLLGLQIDRKPVEMVE